MAPGSKLQCRLPALVVGLIDPGLGGHEPGGTVVCDPAQERPRASAGPPHRFAPRQQVGAERHGVRDLARGHQGPQEDCRTLFARSGTDFLQQFRKGLEQGLGCGEAQQRHRHKLRRRSSACLAVDRPSLVRSVTLLAAGGLIGPATPLGTSFRNATEVKMNGSDCVTVLGARWLSPASDPKILARVECWPAERLQRPEGHGVASAKGLLFYFLPAKRFDDDNLGQAAC